ncbi:Coatomer subunit beta'-2 [Platanthera zijinensis]|uniref:Coatomer subunit beta'-2 n=1 Tax=Platanthera zijinensis TaxID=2320716 RepID=A0AAP0G9Q1_9ASPA
MQDIAIEAQSESKWKQLGELPMTSGKMQLYEDQCYGEGFVFDMKKIEFLVVAAIRFMREGLLRSTRPVVCENCHVPKGCSQKPPKGHRFLNQQTGTSKGATPEA